MSAPLTLPDEIREPGTVESTVFTATHRLDDSGLYTDESLARLIDAVPREMLGFSAMGTDPENYVWGEADVDGFDGATLLEAVKRGRFWLTVRKVMEVAPDHAAAVDELYDALENLCPGFEATRRSANILISSPTAMVYYHVDVPQNILWHVRGRKRVYVYPDWRDDVPEDLYEAVLDADREEDVPYRRAFDDRAEVYDLNPGEWITWPQNTPHRVENLEGLNVSVSTEHYTPRALRYVRSVRANRTLRKFGLRPTSAPTEGVGYAARMGVFTAKRLAEKYAARKAVYEYPTNFRIDFDAEGCMAPIEGRELPEFGRV
ncbi:MAG: cupin-like domain-containing protein [Planctomycetota bacterium]